MKYNVELIRCKRSNPEYQEIRDRHYIPNHGTFGQQIHYLIKLDGETVGIISGASAVYAVKARDDYFGLTKENKRVALNSIINNTVVKLIYVKKIKGTHLCTEYTPTWRLSAKEKSMLKQGG